MKERIKNLYKKLSYSIFCLFPIKSNKVFFEAYYGKKYAGNPRQIYLEVKKRYSDKEFVWVLNEDRLKNQEELNKAKIIHRTSILYYYHLATSKYWVINCNKEGFIVPRKETIFLQTWHAAGAFKKFGLDAMDKTLEKHKEDWKKDGENWTYLLSSSKSIVEIYSDAFGISKEKVKPLGIPRNDPFFHKELIKKQREIFNNCYNKDEKKVILYAPTFRETEKDNFKLNLNLKTLKEKLSHKYIFIIKLHPIIAGSLKISEDLKDFALDLTGYDDIQDLLMVSDVLITDYSSVIFDFAIMGNPIIFYSYDLDYYENKSRGFYFKYKDFVPGPIVYNQQSLEKQLENYEKLKEDNQSKVLDFAKEFNEHFDGKAGERVVDLLFK